MAAAAFGMQAGVVQVGSGSYSDQFPGTDSAGRNGYISVSPAVSGEAAGRPVPTNDWWSSELVKPHGDTMFNYPLAFRPQDDGLVIIKNMTMQGLNMGDTPLKIGLEGLNCTATTVSGHSDWTVTLSWGDMEATMGQGMPFTYFTRRGDADVTVSAMGTLSAEGNILFVSGSYNGADYAVYAPAGSTWRINGVTATTDLAGKDYFSAVMLPGGGDSKATVRQWSKYAFVFPADTRADFSYDSQRGEVETTYSVTPDVKEGTSSDFLFGLLPHHWGNLKGSYSFESGTYQTVRGELRMLGGREFKTSLQFHGVLPTLPEPDAATGFSKEELNSLMNAVNNNDGLSDWTDSYNDGQLLNRLVQTARIARQTGNDALFQALFNKVKARVENWLTYSPGEIAFMFYYHKPWTTMLGYPAGHGQDTNINDHHFHWGYLIHAAAFLEQYEPGWKSRFGGMIDLLVRDAASADRNDTMFPYLRNFSPYAGHCWANGTASIGTGNDQESTSESMQFNCSLIHWGEISGNVALRDLGIYLYVTELSAVEEYWFDVHHRVLPSDYRYAAVSRVFTNSYDSENFWGAGIEGSYGIQLYPVHGGSFYLVHDRDFAGRLWNSMTSLTGILQNEENGNIWYDSWARYYAMLEPESGVEFYKGCTQLGKKFGESQAQTYHWVYSLASYGAPLQDVTADHPLAVVFEKNGVRTYCAQNYGDTPLEVAFSDGFSFSVAPGEMQTAVSGEPLPQAPTATITADPATCKAGEEVTFTAVIDGGDYEVSSAVIKVNGEEISTAVLSRAAAGSYSAKWTAASAGVHPVHAEIIAGGKVFASRPVSYTVESAEPEIPDNPVTPGPGGSSEVEHTFTADDSQEGVFYAGYSIGFMYDSGNSTVTVSAQFQDESLYPGWVTPRLFNYLGSPFENPMTGSFADGYTHTFTGASPGDRYEVAVKAIFANLDGQGGMGVTPRVSYVVPVVTSVGGAEIARHGEIRVWTAAGVPAGCFDAGIGMEQLKSQLSPGIYIMRTRLDDGSIQSSKLVVR